MPKFVNIETGNICGASRPVNTRARLVAWTASQNYVLLFSQHLQARRSRQASAPAGKLLSGDSRPTPFRLDSLQSTTLSGRLLLLSRRQPATAFRRISFHTNPHSLTSASNLHSDSTGKRIHSLILFSFFSFFFLFHSAQKKGNRQSRFPSLFLVIPNLVQI